ncbi:MAG: hypothetical protein V4734_08420, partial [Terriglobus sp.]
RETRSFGCASLRWEYTAGKEGVFAMTTVTTEQVQHELPELLERVRRGETLLIEEGGEPVGTLAPAPVSEATVIDASRRIGFLKGKFSVPDNWKEIDREEIEREFYGEG